MYVVGTAGHVDHGKSSLLRALTKMEPDRLIEEKKRGLTIDLNFLWMECCGLKVGIVDVPGHHRFIKNMVAGVTGIDAYIFLVAADDGWMPQSEEHFQILKSLGVSDGIVVLSKVDLVDESRVVQLESELEARFSKKVLRFSKNHDKYEPVIRSAIENMISTLSKPKDRDKSARIWVDRSFSPLGMGVVVTGTLRDASLAVGDEVHIYPQGEKATVRGLQAYHEPMSEVRPNSRVAVQLAGVKQQAISRGTLIQKGKHGVYSSKVGAVVNWLVPEPKRATKLSCHIGTKRLLANVIPLRKAHIDGIERPVRITFEAGMQFQAGDKLLLRSSGDECFLGTGTIVELWGAQRKTSSLTEQLSLWDGTVQGWINYLMARYGIIDTLQARDLSIFSIDEIESCLQASDWLCIGPGKFIRKIDLEQFAKHLLKALSNEPLSEIVLMTNLEKSLKLMIPAEILSYMQSRGQIAYTLGKWGLPEKEDPLLSQSLAKVKELVKNSNGTPMCFKNLLSSIERKALQRLTQEGIFISLSDEHYLGSQAFDAIKDVVTSFLKTQQSATTSLLREKLNLSRKHTVMILEKLDSQRVTYLKDGVRRLLR